MCKHVAAVLYGIGARLDEQPELLFRLREVNEKDLIAKAGMGLPLANTGPASEKILVGGDLSELFGLELGHDARPASEAHTSGAKPERAKRQPAGNLARLAGGKSPTLMKTGVNAPTKKKRPAKR